MLSFLKKSPLPKQLGLGTLVVSVIIFVSLIIIINNQLNKQISQIVTDHEQTEVQLVSHQLEAKYHLLERLMRRNGAILSTMLENAYVDNSKMQTINGMALPTVTNNHKVINGDSAFIKQFSASAELSASLLIKKNGQFIRVASAMDHPLAAGSMLASSGAGYQALAAGRSFSDVDSINGQLYFASYKQVAGQPNLYYELLVKFSQITTPLANMLKKITFGKTGYIYVTKAGQNKGTFIIHPVEKLISTSIFDLNPKLSPIFEKMYEKDSGILHYSLKVPGASEQARPAKAVFQHVNGWNWVVVLKTYDDEYQAEINATLWLVSALCAMFGLILSLVLWVFIRRALAPLQEISDGLHALGQGDLAFRFKDKRANNSRNEIDLLRNDTIQMRDNLIQLIDKVQHSSTELLNSTHSISKANADLTQSANYSQDVSIQVASAIIQISTAIEEVAQSANEVSNESESVQSMTHEGNAAMTRVEATVSKLSEAFKQASITITNVEESSTGIGKVAGVINEIAEQTNLLALNAAIEAARAGEQGRGFAVVADEVRVLAQRTQQSTEEIRKVIDTLQNNSRSAVQEMENGRNQVNNSIEQVSEASAVLNQILQAMQNVSMGVVSVASATEEQSVAATQIRQNSETLQEASSDTLKQTDLSQEHSQHIQRLANGLQEDLKAFKLK